MPASTDLSKPSRSKPKGCLCFELTKRQVRGCVILVAVLFYLTACGIAYAIYPKISDLPIVWFFGIPVSPHTAVHASNDHILISFSSQLAFAMLSTGLGLACAGLEHAKFRPLVQVMICSTLLAAYMVYCVVVYQEMKQTNDYETEDSFAGAVYDRCLIFTPVDIPSMSLCEESIVAD